MIALKASKPLVKRQGDPRPKHHVAVEFGPLAAIALDRATSLYQISADYASHLL